MDKCQRALSILFLKYLYFLLLDNSCLNFQKIHINRNNSTFNFNYLRKAFTEITNRSS